MAQRDNITVDHSQEEDEVVKILFTSGKGYPPCFSKAPELFESTQQLEVKYQVSAADSQKEVKSGTKAIIIFSVIDKEDLTGVVNWVVQMKPEIKEKKCLVIVFVKGHTQRLEEVLAKAGCYDILKFDTSAKAFAHKMNRTIKLLERDQADLLMDVEISGKHQQAASETDLSLKAKADNVAPLPMSSRIEMVPALQGYPDFWLFRKRVYAKRYHKNWLIEMIGPSLSAGKWEEMGTNQWKWVTREPTSPFSVEPARWVFTGKKPEYSWIVNRWGFVSETPNLSLMQDGKVLASRFSYAPDGGLNLANNSDEAIQLFPTIKETFDRDHRIELTSDHTVPWADHIDSKTIDPSEWGRGDLSPDEMKDWGKGDLSQDDERSPWNNRMKPKEAGSGTRSRIDFATGEEAMKPMGLSGLIKNYEVQIIEYSEDYKTVLVGLDRALVEMSETIQISMKAENIGLQQDYVFEGQITRMEPEDELGKTIAEVTLTPAARESFQQMKDAWEQRQQEILAFFNQVKGAG